MESELCEFNDAYNSTDIQCYLDWVAVTFYYINLRWITIGILGFLIFISIFGKIKSNFRWFILNQAIWDACIIYDIHCNNYYFAGAKCFYRIFLNYPLWKLIIFAAINNIFIYNAYSAFFLLIFSRFLSLYYDDFYEKITKGFRILVFILSVTTIFVLISVLLALFQNLLSDITLQCMKSPIGRNACLKNNDSTYQFYVTLTTIMQKIDDAKRLACILGALIPAIFIIRKVSNQFGYQYYNNRKEFYGSLRIAVVLTFQLLLHAIMLFFESLDPIYFSNVSTEIKDQYGNSFLSILYKFSGYGNVQTFRQIRVFLECVITLIIMTGYRESVFKFFKWIFYRFKKKPVSPIVSNVRSSGILFINEK